MKLLKKIYILNAIFFASLLMFSINSKVLGVEKIEDIKDFNYILKEEAVLVENDDGDFKTDDNGNKYFHYHDIQSEGDTIEIIYNDGTTHTYKYYGGYDDNYSYYDSNGTRLCYIDSNGKYKEPKFSDNQEKVHWKVGTNNYATIEFLGIEKKISVKITESPVKAIKYTTKESYIATDAILDRAY